MKQNLRNILLNIKLMFCIVLYFKVLYCIVLYCIVLFVLYCIVRIVHKCYVYVENTFVWCLMRYLGNPPENKYVYILQLYWKMH